MQVSTLIVSLIHANRSSFKHNLLILYTLFILIEVHIRSWLMYDCCLQEAKWVEKEMGYELQIQKEKIVWKEYVSQHYSNVYIFKFIHF